MPLCFEIQINHERPILADLEELDVLTAIVTFVSSRHELDIQVGGLVKSDNRSVEHVDWIERTLEPGDRLSIHIVDASDPAPPVRRPANLQFDAAREREYYEHLKKKFGD